MERSVEFDRAAGAAVRAGQEGWHHLEVEYTAGVDEILATLSADGPYAYTLMPVPDADGHPRLRIAHSREAIRDAYVDLHSQMRLTRWRSVTEVRSDWYTFHYGLADVTVESTGDQLESESLVLFPTMGAGGITGELFWARTHPSADQDDGLRGLALQLALLDRHDQMLEAYRRGDVEALIAGVAPHVQTAVRDYVDDSGTLVELDGAAQWRRYLEQFFAGFEVVSVEVVRRHVGEWFVFAELWWRLRTRDAFGTFVGCVTADYAEYGPERLVVARIGHGTSLVAAPETDVMGSGRPPR